MAATAAAQSRDADRAVLLAHERAMVGLASDLRQMSLQVVARPTDGGAAVSASGFLWDESGRVITAASRLFAAGDKAHLSVIDSRGREHAAQLIGFDSATDVALLGIAADAAASSEASAFEAMPRGAAGSMALGRTIVGLGNPFGLRGSLVIGVVTGNQRTLAGDGEMYAGMLQTNALFNPGDTGGPVVNAEGELIGMIFSTYGRSPRGMQDRIEEKLTWLDTNRDAVKGLQNDLRSWWRESFASEDPKATPDAKEADEIDAAIDTFFEGLHSAAAGVGKYGMGFLSKDLDFLGAQGISFILPMEQIEWVVGELIAHGVVDRGYLGITVTGVDVLPASGARVARLTPGGPAEAAGLKEGDIVIAFDEAPIRDPDQFYVAVSCTRAGEEHEVTLRRRAAPAESAPKEQGEGASQTIVVTMGKRPSR